VIPLRITMLYARDGDRWVPVFEHTSFGHAPAPHHDGQLYGTTIPAAVVSGDLRDELSRVASPVLFNQLARDPSIVATGPEAMLLHPDAYWLWIPGGLDPELAAQLQPFAAPATTSAQPTSGSLDVSNIGTLRPTE